MLFVTAFGWIACCLTSGRVSGFDSAAYGMVSPWISPENTRLMKAVSCLCSVQAFVLVVALSFLIGYRKKNFRFYASVMALNPAAAWLLNFGLKAVFRRERPDFARLTTETGFSFPSAHAMVGAAFYGYLIYLCVLFLKRPWKQICALFLTLLVFAVGVSRIYLGVHYASDVAAGLLAGFSWAVFLALFLERRRAGRTSAEARVLRKP